jgi:S-adenosylmethionine-diacylglycerol 3-amino-3-carboxypropyl transferase
MGALRVSRINASNEARRMTDAEVPAGIPAPDPRAHPARRARNAESSGRRRAAPRPVAGPARPVPVLPALIPTGSEVAYRADFSEIRYAQCWEDADVLLEALAIQPGDVCLSVASAGDNALAMLARHPARVFAIDLNPAQLACLELRVAAYRLLDYDDLLVLLGSRRGFHRHALYQRCRSLLSRNARAFWDERPEAIAAGIASAGKFERSIAVLRSRLMPFLPPPDRIHRMLAGGSRAERVAFFIHDWDTAWVRLLIAAFLPRLMLARAGRDLRFLPVFDPELGRRALAQAQRVLCDLDPAANPYLHWLLTGTHGQVLPFALRPENVLAIRANLDRLEWRHCAIEDVLAEVGDRAIDRFNLSDIFEYLTEPAFHTLLYRLARTGRRGGRLAYWNTLAVRRRPPIMADMLLPLTGLAESLQPQDKVGFYRDFVVEGII